MNSDKFKSTIEYFKFIEDIHSTSNIIQRIDVIIYNPVKNCYLTTKHGFIGGCQCKNESQFEAAKRIVEDKIGIEIFPEKIIDSYQIIFESFEEQVHINSIVIFARYYEDTFADNIRWLQIYDKINLENDFHEAIFKNVYSKMYNYIINNEIKSFDHDYLES